MKTTFSRQALAAIFALTSMTLQAQPALDSTFQDAQGITYVVTKATAPYEAQVLGGNGNPNNTVQVNNPVIPATVTDGDNTFAVVGIQKYAFGISITDVLYSDHTSALSGDVLYYEYLTGTLTIECGGSIGDYAFPSCGGLSGTLTIPSSVTDIGHFAFHLCTGLTELTLNNSGIVGSSAFSLCYGLTSVDFSAYTGDNIDSAVFFYCSSLSKLTFGAPVAPTVGKNAFENVAPIGTLYYPEGGTGYDVLLSDYLPSGWVAKVGNATVGFSNALSVRAISGGLQVSGLVPGEALALYNMQGSLIYSDKASANEQRLPLREHGIYIIVSGKRTAKAVY
jgi:hypothetical protein